MFLASTLLNPPTSHQTGLSSPSNKLLTCLPWPPSSDTNSNHHSQLFSPSAPSLTLQLPRPSSRRSITPRYVQYAVYLSQPTQSLVIIVPILTYTPSPSRTAHTQPPPVLTMSAPTLWTAVLRELKKDDIKLEGAAQESRRLQEQADRIGVVLGPGNRNTAENFAHLPGISHQTLADRCKKSLEQYDSMAKSLETIEGKIRRINEKIDDKHTEIDNIQLNAYDSTIVPNQVQVKLNSRLRNYLHLLDHPGFQMDEVTEALIEAVVARWLATHPGAGTHTTSRAR
jgi:hypothetical protein